MVSLAPRPDLLRTTSARERHRLELIIATARTFLAAGALLAISLEPSGPHQYAETAYKFLVLYDIHSFVVLVLIRFWRLSSPRFGALLHVIDIGWAVGITFLTEGPSSPYFALFVFVLLAAAYRWGFRETLTTGIVAAVLLAFQAVAVSLGLVSASMQLSELIMRSTYFMLATFLLAYLSNQAHGLRAEAAVINRLTDKVNAREGLAASIYVVLRDLLELCGSRRATVVLKELSTGRVVLWDAADDRAESASDVNGVDLDAAQRRPYLFSVPPNVTAWEQSKRWKHGKERIDSLAIDKEGKPVRGSQIAVPADFHGGGWTTLLALRIGFSNDWVGVLCILDPTARPSGDRRLRFLQGVMVHITPVLQNAYLLRRFGLRVGALERARVARELHDSVIQSLTAVEMQLDVARRDGAVAQGTAGKLTYIQNLLRQEILNVRDLMEQLRPHPDDARHLGERLTELADRFHRETGIDVRFRSNVDHFDLPAELCHELTRIVQEALINIRKHSGAANVLLSLHVDDAAWKLIIADDGRGFGFVGTASHAELAAGRIGPRTIRERVEVIGATLQMRSGPDGARLEINGGLNKPWMTTPSV